MILRKPWRIIPNYQRTTKIFKGGIRVNVSFSMFYLSVITLKFPYNKMFKSHQHQQTQQIQTIIKDKEWDSKIETICNLIDIISTGILSVALSTRLYTLTHAVFWFVIPYGCGCVLIWNIDFLLVSLFFCKCSYSAFLKEWETL